MSEQSSRVIIGVIGMDEHGPGEPIPKEAWHIAEEVGRLVAERGAILLAGGRRGIMEASSRGANLAGGIVVGVLPSSSKAEANPYVNVPIATGLNGLRSHVIIQACDAIIMVCGSTGTLNEATLAYGYGRPLIVIEGTGGWADRLRPAAYKGQHLDQRGTATIQYVSGAAEAVDKAFEVAEAGVEASGL
jgi:uncharacterized protein (TIGR00725 family)